MARAFSGIVQSVFGKFNRKAMVWTFVHTSNESFHHLIGEEFEIRDLNQVFLTKPEHVSR